MSLTTGAEDRHFIDSLLRHAEQRPNAVAIRDRRGRAMTWIELASAVDCQTERLVGHRRIAHTIHNEIADVVVALGCLAAGTVEVALDARYSKSHINELVRRSQAIRIESPSINKVHLRKSDPLKRLRNAAEQLNIHSASLVLWTSGTTNRPQGVMLSANSLITNAVAKLSAVPQNINDHRLSVLPISHAYARTCDMGTWLLSGCEWTIDLGGSAIDRIDPTQRPTLINGVPSIAREIAVRIRSNEGTLANLKTLGCGGAAMGADQFHRLRDLGIEVIQGYGCTETSPVICSARVGRTSPGCVGPLVDGWEADVRDERLFVRGEGVMIAYLDDPESTRQKIDADGWLDTGDLVQRDHDGEFRIQGRADDVIVLDNGYKIHPQSIEAAIQELDRVDHAVVFKTGSNVNVAMAGTGFDRDSIDRILAEHLPTKTKVDVQMIDPPLSKQRNEFTAKGTVRRSVFLKRFQN